MKRTICLIITALLILSLCSCTNGWEQKYNDLRDRYSEETKEKYSEGYDAGYKDGHEDGYNKCQSDFKEMSPAERNDFLNDGIEIND